MTGEPCRLTATELLARYRARTLSPVEAVQALLRRIEAVDPGINAMALVDAEGALTAARAAERRWQRGEPAGLLDGVPVALKDGFAVAGLPSYDGSLAANEAGVPDAVDAPVTARLREAGAVILGKTTMPDFGLIPSGVSSRFGITRNPWDPTRSSGGSSAGSGAALAAGLCPLAVGTDGGGSVRIPSAFCGVFGLKPSYGRVPMDDPSPWVVAGPMARSVADAALLLDVISAPDARDDTALPPHPRDHRDGLDAGVRGLRIGVLEDIGFGTAVDPQVRAALHATARVLEGLGAVVEPVPPPFDDDPEPVFDQLLHMRTYTMFAAMSAAQRAAMGPALSSWCGQEVQGSKLQLMQALVAVGEIRRRTLAPFQRHDFVLAPVMADLLFEAERPWAPGPSPHNPFCFPFNMSEQPAASVHGGFSREGWPIGLQVVGRRFDDRGVLRVAQACEAASGLLALTAASGPACR